MEGLFKGEFLSLLKIWYGMARLVKVDGILRFHINEINGKMLTSPEPGDKLQMKKRALCG